MVTMFSPADAAAQTNPIVVMDTSLGAVTIELFRDKAPASADNFLSYVKDGFYEGTTFHRVIKGFMIQGGGHLPDLSRKPTKAPIKNEATNGLTNDRGTLALARTAEVNSATSQFFINTVNNVALNHKSTDPQGYGYAVFGRVIDGMAVVDKIESVPTGTQGGMRDVPTQPVTIKSVKVKTP
jgi:cyclophilin family peptidyl-prolyl cis-trans isomerase